MAGEATMRSIRPYDRGAATVRPTIAPSRSLESAGIRFRWSLPIAPAATDEVFPVRVNALQGRARDLSSGGELGRRRAPGQRLTVGPRSEGPAITRLSSARILVMITLKIQSPSPSGQRWRSASGLSVGVCGRALIGVNIVLIVRWLRAGAGSSIGWVRQPLSANQGCKNRFLSGNCGYGRVAEW
jgi:hypothetical protein